MAVRSDQMLDIARELAARDAGHPGQPSLTRAVSTAYYALFRALQYEVVSSTITWGFKSDHYWDTVRPLYRAVDHGQAKTVFGRLLNDRASSDDLKRLARTFVDLQSERIRADYDPHPAFRRSEASELIEQAASAVALIRKLPVETRRVLVVLLLAKHR